MKKWYYIAVVMAAVTIGVGAADIVANFTLQVSKGSLNIQRTIASSISITNTNPNVAGFTQLIPTNTAGTAITLGDVVTNGVCWFRNLSTNNYIEVGVQVSGAFYPTIRLNYGEAWPFRMAWTCTPYARANGAPVVLEKLIFDN